MAVTLRWSSATSKSGVKAWMTAKATAVWIKYGCFNTFPLDVKKVKGCCFHTLVFLGEGKFIGKSFRKGVSEYSLLTVQKEVMGGKN